MKMKLTADELLTGMPNIGQRLSIFLEPLNAAMEEFEINTYPRMAMFLAQVAHESGELRYMEEIWGPTDAQRTYDKRADLGNTEENAIRIAALHGSTPGYWWRGRSPIQTTGYTNYLLTGNALGLDLLNHPELIGLPKDGCRAAAYFFKSRGLNTVADKDDENAFKVCTHRVNGGVLTYDKEGNAILKYANHYEERKEFWIRFQEALGA